MFCLRLWQRHRKHPAQNLDRGGWMILEANPFLKVTSGLAFCHSRCCHHSLRQPEYMEGTARPGTDQEEKPADSFHGPWRDLATSGGANLFCNIKFIFGHEVQQAGCFEFQDELLDPFFRQADVFRFDLVAQVAPVALKRGDGRAAAAHERVQDEVAFIGVKLDEAVGEGYRKRAPGGRWTGPTPPGRSRRSW